MYSGAKADDVLPVDAVAHGSWAGIEGARGFGIAARLLPATDQIGEHRHLIDRGQPVDPAYPSEDRDRPVDRGANPLRRSEAIGVKAGV